MLQAGHRRNNSGDVGLWRRPASDEEEVSGGMRSRRSRSELVLTRGDAFDRRPRHQRRRQGAIADLRRGRRGGVGGSVRRRGRRAEAGGSADRRGIGGRESCFGLRSLRLARFPRAVAVLTPFKSGGRSLVSALGALKLRTERYAIKELPVWRPGQSSTVMRRQRKSIKRLVEKSIKTAGRGVLKGAGPRPQDDPDVAVVAVARNPQRGPAAAYAELNRDEGPAGPAVSRRVRARPAVRPGLRARSVVLGADAGAVRGRRERVCPTRRAARRAEGGRPRAAGAEQLRADHDPRGAAGY